MDASENALEQPGVEPPTVCWVDDPLQLPLTHRVTVTSCYADSSSDAGVVWDKSSPFPGFPGIPVTGAEFPISVLEIWNDLGQVMSFMNALYCLVCMQTDCYSDSINEVVPDVCAVKLS